MPDNTETIARLEGLHQDLGALIADIKGGAEAPPGLPRDGESPELTAAPALRPGYLSAHFRAAELGCNHCGSLGPAGIDPQLLELLEAVRGHFNASVIVNSGYRCPEHNARVGGAKHSQHLQGTAADIRVAGVSAARVHAWLADHMAGWGGLGAYRTFTHCDTRPNGPARWGGG